MATATNKQRLLTHLFTALKKRYGAPEPEARPVLEQFLYAVCREGTGREQADQAYRTLRESFFDWNEVRVSSVREIEEVLDDLPDAEARANRIITFLQEVFETTFSFDLETLHKKGLKQAAKHLSRYQAANDFTVAWVTQQGLGGHAIPVDGPILRCLRRLHLVEEGQEDPETIRTALEHLIPKAKGQLFYELLSALADEFCLEEPKCNACPLSGECPTAQGLTGNGTSERVARVKPR